MVNFTRKISLCAALASLIYTARTTPSEFPKVSVAAMGLLTTIVREEKGDKDKK